MSFSSIQESSMVIAILDCEGFLFKEKRALYKIYQSLEDKIYGFSFAKWKFVAKEIIS